MSTGEKIGHLSEVVNTGMWICMLAPIQDLTIGRNKSSLKDGAAVMRPALDMNPKNSVYAQNMVGL